MGPLARLRGLLERRVDRDGRAAVLEAAVDPVLASLSGGDALGRRERGFGRPTDILVQSLSQKVLDGWLQNRHQILVPLTFRLGRLPADDADLLMRFAAAALLDGSSGSEGAIAASERWLATVGADGPRLAAFRAAVSDPAPLSLLIADVKRRGLEPYAYAAAVAVADTREAAGHLFANYIAARLMLPADAIRSIDRRYRR